MMSSVNSQIQKAIGDAIRSQILPQIQSALSAGSGHSTQSKWNVPSERPKNPKFCKMQVLEITQEVSQTVAVLWTDPQTCVLTTRINNEGPVSGFLIHSKYIFQLF